MPYAIRIHEHGGPEAMRWEEAVGDPGPGEVRLEQRAVGSTTSTSITAPAFIRSPRCRRSSAWKARAR